MRILKSPKVYLLVRPQIVEEEFQAFLSDSNLEWPTPTENVQDAERLVEISGRCCYMSFGKKAGSKTNKKYIQNLLGRNDDGSFKPGPAHGSVCEHPCWSFLIVGAGRGFCYDENTEVLTNEGWKFWADIRGDEEFATLNLKKDELQYQHATNIIREDYDGEMYNLQSKMVNLSVTLNHNMLFYPYDKRVNKVWQISEAKNIIGKRVKYKRNVANWNGLDLKEFEIPTFCSEQKVSNQHGDNYSVRSIDCKGKIVDAGLFAEFLGYWLAEGGLDHYGDGGYFVTLSQNDNTDVIDCMKKCIEGLGFTYSIHSTGISDCKQIRVNGGRSLYEYLKPYSGVLNKKIPPEIKKWSKSLLIKIINKHLEGDGSFPRRGSGEGHTVSKQLSDDLQEIALKCGFSATVREVDRRKESPRILDGHEIRHKHIVYVVSYCKVRNEPLVNHNGKIHDCVVKYVGKIYCATVPNGILYVRRNGRPVWCGNSHEQVRHRTGWAYSQLSTRYCDFEREEEGGTWEPGFCIPPLAQLSKESADLFADKIKKSQQSYCELLSIIENDLKNNEKFMQTLSTYDERERKRMLRKAARGAARDILPIATEAIMVMSANARAIWNCIYLRANEHAEAVIRDIYVQIAKKMEKEMPALFNGLKYEKCWDGSEVVLLPRDKL